MIHLSEQDMNALAGDSSHSKNRAESQTEPGEAKPPSNAMPLVFLYNVTRDNINTCQTCNLIFSLTRNNPELAERVAGMVFHGVRQTGEQSMHFFRLLTLLTEFSGGPSGMPCYTSLVMHRVWDLAKACPQAALDWLSIQTQRNRYVQKWLLSTMENWVETYLMAHPNQKVRNSAAFLIVSLVPSTHFRQAFRNTASRTGCNNRSAELLQSPSSADYQEQLETLHQILEFLFRLLPNAKQYIDLQHHGSAKLVAYFQTMTHFLLTKNEKLMFCGKDKPHFDNLWSLFHPKLSEPSIPVHHNKQALLNFWYNLCLECPENVQLILENPSVTKNIAFNYILADHEDHEVVAFNRIMLPTYYGLLRMCCLQSRTFTRQLSLHQNLQWAFKNITPYTTQYTLACEELFKLMSLFVDNKDGEGNEVATFRRQALQLYLTTLDGRTSWSALVSACKILIASNEDRLFVVYNNGLPLVSEAFNMLHMMYHEATACHVTSELTDLLNVYAGLIKAVRLVAGGSPTHSTSSVQSSRSNSEMNQVMARWKDMGEVTNRLLTLVNSFSPPELREVCLTSIKEMLMLWPTQMLGILVPILHRAHAANTTNNASGNSEEYPILGPYFPTRSRQRNLKRSNTPRPMFQMFVPTCHLEAHHGQDPEYDRALQRYFLPYHGLVDLMVRLSVNEDLLNKMLVDLSSMVGLDGATLHFQLFPKLWTDIHDTEVINEARFPGKKSPIS